MRTSFAAVAAIVAAGVVAGSVGCTSPSDPVPEAPVSTLLPGLGAADVRLGDTYGAVKTKLGEAEATGSNRLVFARYPAKGLELVFASVEGDRLTDESRLVAVGVQRGASCAGSPCPGERKDAIEARLGAPDDATKTLAFYGKGLSVVYADDGTATQVSAFAPYTPESSPREMTEIAAPPGKATRPALGVDALGVVDMHLHPGFYGRIPSTTKALFVEGIPPFARPYAPGVSGAALDTFSPVLGIVDQTRWAGVDHAVLFAVYTQKTTGFFTNEDLASVLTQKENVAADGLPWAFGLASVSFFDGFVRDDGTVDEAVATKRYAALSSCFERRPDLFVGIKLAHPHQQIALDDRRYLGVYDVAKKYGVPVYLHTGFSPFPTAKNVPESYDPINFEGVLRSYPDVPFVLGHVGQGDKRAVAHALDLAKRYPNVHLEVSALGRPFLKDENGADLTPDPKSPQLPYVMTRIKEDGLVAKAIFGSDGPQFSGMVKGYVGQVRAAMAAAGYSESEQKDVMGRNFTRLFFRAR